MPIARKDSLERQPTEARSEVLSWISWEFKLDDWQRTGKLALDGYIDKFCKTGVILLPGKHFFGSAFNSDGGFGLLHDRPKRGPFLSKSEISGTVLSKSQTCYLGFRRNVALFD